MSEQTEAARRATIRTVEAADPSDVARSMAASEGAEVAADLRTAEQAVRVRVEAGRRGLGDPDADAELVARAAAIRAAAAVPPPIAPEQVVALEQLAAELDRATRIRERTEARFATAIQAKLAISSGVTLHPDALRGASTAVLRAEADIAAADAALAALGERPAEPATPPAAPPGPAVHPLDDHRGLDAVAAHDDDPVLQRPHDVFDELALDKRRATARAITVGGVLAVLGIIALVGGQAIIGIALLGAAAAAGIAIVVRGHRAAEDEDAGRVRSAARLDGFVPELPESLRFDPPPMEERASRFDTSAVASWNAQVTAWQEATALWDEQQATIAADRLDAVERLRVAEHRWSQLAGPGTDPHDPEPIIRANDPQLADDPRVAEGSPTVRTVAAFHRTVQAKWRVLWASLGVDEPPGPEELDARLADVLGDSHLAVAELGQLEAAEARIAARIEASRTLVLVEPNRWVRDARLQQLLASVPPEGTVVIIDRPPTS